MKNLSLFNADQSNPVRNDSTPISLLAIEDLKERMELGAERYGSVLQAHNGRDPLIDAYQEVMDLLVYLRQALFEKYGQ